jgi:hypothetical protein
MRTVITSPLIRRVTFGRKRVQLPGIFGSRLTNVSALTMRVYTNLIWRPVKGFRADKLARFRGIYGHV